MKIFKVHKLSQLTKSTYESQQRWIDKNWKDTLKKHHRETEDLLRKIGVFDEWKNILAGKYGKVANELIPEIFMDAYISIHFACIGLYKQANVCLRAQLETALRLVYFSTHSVEFQWWNKGKGEYFKRKDVWGEEYTYFRRLEAVQGFQKKCKENGYNIILFDKISSLYGELSQYVHSGVSSFQTTPDRFSPKYKKREFENWVRGFKKSQKYINTILTLGFADEFKSTRVNAQKRILKVVENNKFKKGLRQSLDLKIRGRI